jgi:hypothetical protein
MERIIKFIPAFHKIHEDPDKNYGVGSVRCIMTLKGEKGATSFVFGIGIYLPQTYEYWESRGLHKDCNKYPDHMGYDVSYHALSSQWEGQTSRDNCEFLDGKPCYGDGSALRADEWMKIFVEQGDEPIWKMLEEDYKERF